MYVCICAIYEVTDDNNHVARYIVHNNDSNTININ